MSILSMIPDTTSLASSDTVVDSRTDSSNDLGSGDDTSLANPQHLEALLKQTEAELEALQPEIETLETVLVSLNELRKKKQTLISMKLSLQSILQHTSLAPLIPPPQTASEASGYRASLPSVSDTSEDSILRVRKRNAHKSPLPEGPFIPEDAFAHADTILMRKDSLNYELFKAIVFNGGMANTEQIKAYLLSNFIKQPATGEGFEAVPLTDISSRVNYLIRKGLVHPMGQGHFVCVQGWNTSETAPL
jgi:hypothetical protein